MAGVLQGTDGGIQSLLDLPWEHWEALVADLARLGWTIDDIPHRLDWVAVCALARHAGEGTALYRVRSRMQEASNEPRPVGHYSDWPVDRHIAVLELDELRIANWQRANAGRKSPTAPPKPMWRPGVEAEVDEHGFRKNADGSKQVGRDPIPANQFHEWWNATQEERENWKAVA